MSWKSRLLRLGIQGLLLPLLVLNGWALLLLFNYFRNIITILVVATLLSFLLDYPVTGLRRWGLSRRHAVLLVLLAFGGVLFVLGITLVPLMIEQAHELSERLPTWIASGTQQLSAIQAWAEARQLPVNLNRWITQLEDQLSSQLQAASGMVVSTVVDTLSSLFAVMLTLVLTFYLLLHGPQLWEGLFSYLPGSTGTQIRDSLRLNFHNYFISQATLALLMGSAMTLAFFIVGVPFTLVFGLGIGVMALFPYGVALGIVLVSFLTALSSIWLGLRVLVVAVIIDQLIENGVAPQLMGRFIGLSPVWILLSLLIGVRVAGLLGLVIAVPVAGSIKDLLQQHRTPSQVGQGMPTPPKSPQA